MIIRYSVSTISFSVEVKVPVYHPSNPCSILTRVNVYIRVFFCLFFFFVYFFYFFFVFCFRRFFFGFLRPVTHARLESFLIFFLLFEFYLT